VPGSPPASGVSPQQVRVRAYEIFLGRLKEGGSGDELSDWLQAERELIARQTRAGRSEPVALRPNRFDLHSSVRGEVLLHDAD
jgi:hypothetical protein